MALTSPMVGGHKTGLARKLAHNQKHVRDEAMGLVVQWIQHHPHLDQLDCLKLWKALYYCMWMSDKPLVQQELAENLAEIIQRLQPDRAVPFARAFFQTMMTEWDGTDRLRLDKFLSLIRKMVRSIFAYIFREEHIHDGAVCTSFIDVLESSVLSTTRKQAHGFPLHIADVFIDELSSAMEDVPQAADPAAFDRLRQLLAMMLALITTKGCHMKLVAKRVHDVVFQRLLNDAEAVAKDESVLSVTNLVTISLLNLGALAGLCLDAAADPATAERVRSQLYDLRQRLVQLQVQVEAALMDSDDDAPADGMSSPDSLPINAEGNNRSASPDPPVVVADTTKEEPGHRNRSTPTRSVSFSTTKSIRKFNKRIPMKVTTSARELNSKTPNTGVLKRQPSRLC